MEKNSSKGSYSDFPYLENLETKVKFLETFFEKRALDIMLRSENTTKYKEGSNNIRDDSKLMTTNMSNIDERSGDYDLPYLNSKSSVFAHISDINTSPENSQHFNKRKVISDEMSLRGQTIPPQFPKNHLTSTNQNDFSGDFASPTQFSNTANTNGLETQGRRIVNPAEESYQGLGNYSPSTERTLMDTPLECLFFSRAFERPQRQESIQACDRDARGDAKSDATSEAISCHVQNLYHETLDLGREYDQLRNLPIGLSNDSLTQPVPNKTQENLTKVEILQDQKQQLELENDGLCSYLKEIKHAGNSESDNDSANMSKRCVELDQIFTELSERHANQQRKLSILDNEAEELATYSRALCAQVDSRGLSLDESPPEPKHNKILEELQSAIESFENTTTQLKQQNAKLQDELNYMAKEIKSSKIREIHYVQQNEKLLRTLYMLEGSQRSLVRKVEKGSQCEL